MESKQFTRFVVLLQKVPDREMTRQMIERHVEHLRRLDGEDRLVLCGPFEDHPSGMVILKAADKAEAVALAETDPFVQEGVRTFEVRTWLLACEENGYLL